MPCAYPGCTRTGMPEGSNWCKDHPKACKVCGNMANAEGKYCYYCNAWIEDGTPEDEIVTKQQFLAEISREVASCGVGKKDNS